MPGFGGSPFAALLGAIPGGLVAREELGRKRSREDLQNQQLEEAIRIANAQESRAAGQHPLTLEGLQQSLDLGEFQLGAAGRTDEAVSGLLGMPEFAGEDAASALLRASASAGDFGMAESGLFPFGRAEGGVPQTQEGFLAGIEGEAEARARGGGFGKFAPPGAGSQLSFPQQMSLLGTQFTTRSVPELKNIITGLGTKAASEQGLSDDERTTLALAMAAAQEKNKEALQLLIAEIGEGLITQEDLQRLPFPELLTLPSPAEF